MFTGTPKPFEAHTGPMGGAYSARSRELDPETRAKVIALAVENYHVEPDAIVFLDVREFETALGDGSVGEVALRYGSYSKAIIGLYADGHIETWMD